MTKKQPLKHLTQSGHLETRRTEHDYTHVRIAVFKDHGAIEHRVFSWHRSQALASKACKGFGGGASSQYTEAVNGGQR